MSHPIPPSLEREHEELHRELRNLTSRPGDLGQAARAVAELLAPHFHKEEELALPPLGALMALTRSQLSDAEREIPALTDRLSSELPQMLREHEAVVEALAAVSAAGRAAGVPEAEAFAEKLELHARMEEEVLYPAALLVGDYIRMADRLRDATA